MRVRGVLEFYRVLSVFPVHPARDHPEAREREEVGMGDHGLLPTRVPVRVCVAYKKNCFYIFKMLFYSRVGGIYGLTDGRTD